MRTMTEQPIISIDSVDEYNKMYGFETFHPLVTVVDIAAPRPSIAPTMSRCDTVSTPCG